MRRLCLLLVAACGSSPAPATKTPPPAPAPRVPGEPRALWLGDERPQAIAARDGKAYWTMPTGIMTEEGVFVVTHKPNGVALDAEWIYWTSVGGDVAKRRRYGGEVVTLASGQVGAHALTVHDGMVYWLTLDMQAEKPVGDVMSVAASGGALSLIAEEELMPIALAVDGWGVYWASFGDIDAIYQDGRVRMALHGGGGAVTLVEEQSGVISVASDATHVYWATYYGRGPSISRVAKQGGAAELVVQVAQTQVGGRPSAVAVDDRYVYWLDLGSEAQEYGDGALRRMPKGGGDIQTIAAGQAQPSGLVLDDAGAYWINGGGMGGASEVMTVSW